jgi:hypothetical protein
MFLSFKNPSGGTNSRRFPSVMTNRFAARLALVAVVAVACGPTAFGVTISSGDLVGGTYTFTDNFTGFLGTADPTNWTTADVASTSTWQGDGTGTSGTGGKYSFGTGPEDATFEGSLGFLPSSSRAISASISFTNATGAPLESFVVSYVGEQWREVAGGNDNNWTATYAVDGGSPVSLPSLTFTPQRATNASGSLIFSQNLSSALTGLTLANGSTLTVSFLGSNGAAGGSRQGIAIDNFQVAAVPEPSTFGLAAAGVAIAGLGAWKRRRSGTAVLAA